MSPRTWFFSSESVTEGHPDKVSDAVSDAVLDAALTGDRMSRVACETLVTTGIAIVAGEITTQADLDIDRIVRRVVRDIGYDGFDPDFSADTIQVDNRLHRQSPDIADGVTGSLERRMGSEDEWDYLGAGDQGIMFGFACDETPELMPLPIQLAHRVAERLSEVRRSGVLAYLRPDGKTQVTVRYEGDRPVAVTNLLISAHHAPAITLGELEADLTSEVVKPVLAAHLGGESVPLLVNPSGRFEIGGPVADTGLTGRKIIVDTYGGYARHGGGAFSGKDSTKVDRSGAYAARHAAKNVVAAGLARRCEVQLAYAIGQARPFSIQVETFGTERVAPEHVERALAEVFDFRPAAIISRLGLREPIFSATTAYGHFGRADFPWERTDRTAELAELAGL
ncbi:MAG TPA: methionine adenosyltransferase [Acidimicrobiia bacterium]|nr:methionine adenosyltransferase [Acidimicrobiia bacterium]